MKRLCLVLLLVGLSCSAYALSAAPGRRPSGLQLCFPRPQAGDSIVIAPLEHLLVNGNLAGEARSLMINGQAVELHAQGRFATRIPWPGESLELEWITDAGLQRDRLVLLPPQVDRESLPPERSLLPGRHRLQERTAISTAPGASYWLFPLPQALVELRESDGRWGRLELGASLEGWVPLARLEPAAGPFREPALAGSALRYEGEARWSFALRPGPLVHHIEDDGSAGPLRLQLPGVFSAFDRAELDPAGLLEHMDWEALPGGGTELKLHTASDVHGISVSWEDGRMVLELQRAPRSLKGARILLDPGHGGEESGCIGASGMTEARLNRLLAEELARQLERKGAEVLWTVRADERMGLYDRVAVCDSLQPDLFLSLHHNSVPEDGDPWSTPGFSVYYYTGYSAKAARLLHEELADWGRLPDDGLHWRSLAVCRQWTCPALLLEAGSLIHPGEEELLLDERFRRAQAKKIRKALQEYFRSVD